MEGRSRATVEWSAGGVVLRTIDGTAHAMLIRDPYRNWGLPKGHLEEGESRAEAALREVAEETGLEDLTLGPELATIDWFFRAEGRLVHKFCAFFLMGSRLGEARPQASEGITECRWLPLEEAAAWIGYENTREVVEAARGMVDGSGRLPEGL